VKELLEQYKRIQGLAIGLRHVNQDLPGFVADEAVEVMINKINLKMHALAHEIVRELQQQPDDSIKQLDEPEEAGKPELTVWCLKNKATGKYLACQYVIQLFRSHNDAWSHRTWFGDKVDWIPEVYDGTQDAEWNVKGPEPINNVLHKPLWAVLPADAEDDAWQKQLGPRKQLSYQLFLAQSHAEEYASQLRKSKVVPVWGE
jgi:hypothetical protein